MAPAGAAAVRGGQPVAVDETPWIAQLWVDGGFKCGASLIAPRFVLTAAHCVASGSPPRPLPRGRVEVRLGRSTLFSDGGEVHQLAKIFPHPFYRSARGLQNDVAVLELYLPTTTTPVRLAKPSEAARWRPGRVVRVLGWGRTSQTGGESNLLQRATIHISSRQRCERFWRLARDRDYDPSVMLCAGLGDIADTCKADSGGPLLASVGGSHALAGVTSFGPPCDTPDPASVYARVGDGPLRSWVAQTAGLASRRCSASRLYGPSRITAVKALALSCKQAVDRARDAVAYRIENDFPSEFCDPSGWCWRFGEFRARAKVSAWSGSTARAATSASPRRRPFRSE